MRVARPRRFLMCRPTHFEVSYAINPWMNPGKPTDAPLAITQWERLRAALTDLGHRVDLVDPVPGLPDMVFAANAGTVVDGRVLTARFRHPERAAEAPAFEAWFRATGMPVRAATFVNEGEGDYLVTGSRLLAGHGFRTDHRSHAEAADWFGRPVVSLTLVDDRFYHLDTALAVLDDDEVMYYPGAFSRRSLGLLRELYPGAIEATEADAEVFGLNAISDGRNVVLPQQATGLAERLRDEGFTPVGVDLSELLKAGGAAKCCALELRPGTWEAP